MPIKPALISAKDPLRAAVLLTRLPVPGADGARAAASAWAWPLVGLAVAGLAAGGASLALGIGLSPAVAAGLSLMITIVVTGALHEDGLADCADGFWGGHTRERRLDIMHDSRIGSYGVLALSLVIGLKWLLLAELFAEGAVWTSLIVAAAISRTWMAVMMNQMTFARDDGLALHVGRPRGKTAGLALGLGLAIVLLFIGLAALLVLGLCALVAVGVARLASLKIGGQTGDVLGAIQCLTEMAALMTLSILLV